MYTNIPGYKFHIGIGPIGGLTCVNTAMLLQLYVQQGEYDDQLLWPAKATFTLELVNQNNRGNIKCELLKEWEKPSQAEAFLGAFHRMDAMPSCSYAILMISYTMTHCIFQTHCGSDIALNSIISVRLHTYYLMQNLATETRYVLRKKEYCSYY